MDTPDKQDHFLKSTNRPAVSLNESLEVDDNDRGTGEAKISYFYLFSVVFTCGLSSWQLGAALSASGCVFPDLIYLFSIPEDEASSYLTMLTSSAIGGVAVGSILGGFLISR